MANRRQTRTKYPPLPDRERVEFEELTRLLRNISNSLWTVSSLFITINAITVIPVVEMSSCYPFVSLCVSVIFIFQWIFTVRFFATMIELSYNIIARIKSLNPHWKNFLGSTIRPEIKKIDIDKSPIGSEIKKIDIDKSPILKLMESLWGCLIEKPLISNALVTPWGRLMISLATFLILGWVALLIHFIVLSFRA